MIDFYKYLWGKAVKTDRVNEPDLLEFALAPWDNLFTRPTRGDYLSLNTATYGIWFTGYITNDPELEYLGTQNNAPVWGYKYQATGDEYILNLQLLGFQPPFVNTSQGKILATLINRLVPNLFDTSGIQDGMVIAEYEIDPEKRFSDVVKEFADAAYFRFAVQNHTCTYAPVDATPAALVVDGNDKHFTPSKLKVKALVDPLINDALVVGDIESQHYVSEYFIGDGFTGKFPCISSVFGLAEQWLIDDAFSGGSINTTNWILEDQLNFIQFSAGTLNCVGGPGNYNTSFVQSTNVIPLEGSLRLTHGDIDVVLPSQGIIGGLWINNPSNNLADCLYGILLQGSNFYPIVNGVPDFTQTKAINTNNRYVLRTIANFYQSDRVVTEWGFLDNIGITDSFGGNTIPGTVDYHTIIVEIDPITGNIIQPIPGVNYTRLTTLSIPLGDTTTYAFYAPVVNNNLNISLTGCAVSYPLQARLETFKRDLWLYPDPPSWGSNSPINNIAQYVRTAGVSTIVTSNPPVQYGTGQWVEVVIPDDPSFNGVWPVTGVASSGANGPTLDTFQFHQAATLVDVPSTPALDGQVQIVSYPATEQLVISAASRTGGVVDLQLASAPTTTAASFIAGINVVITNPEDPSFSAVATISAVISPTEFQYHQLQLADGAALGVVGGLVMAQVAVPNIPYGWQSLLLGPNEVDSQDGLAPAATITDSAAGRSVAQHGIKHALFNPGQASLEFFKDTTTQTSDIPGTGDIIHLSYRHAGVAMGRVVDNTSVTQEATKWGDSGHRQTVKKDVTPLPHTSEECEAVAAAIVSDWGYQHYEGSYDCTNLYSLVGEPLSGSVLKFQNLPAAFLPIQQEEVHEVKTTFDWTSFRTGQEIFLHSITFGRADHMRKALAKFSFPKSSYIPQDSTLIPDAIDVTTVVNGAFLEDVVAPKVTHWDNLFVYIDFGQPPPPGGEFEVRYSDDGWSPTVDGANLVIRTSGTGFALPRSSRGKICYIKANNVSGGVVSGGPPPNPPPPNPPPPSGTSVQLIKHTNNTGNTQLDTSVTAILQSNMLAWDASDVCYAGANANGFNGPPDVYSFDGNGNLLGHFTTWSLGTWAAFGGFKVLDSLSSGRWLIANDGGINGQSIQGAAINVAGMSAGTTTGVVTPGGAYGGLFGAANGSGWDVDNQGNVWVINTPAIFEFFIPHNTILTKITYAPGGGSIATFDMTTLHGWTFCYALLFDPITGHLIIGIQDASNTPMVVRLNPNDMSIVAMDTSRTPYLGDNMGADGHYIEKQGDLITFKKIRASDFSVVQTFTTYDYGFSSAIDKILYNSAKNYAVAHLASNVSYLQMYDLNNQSGTGGLVFSDAAADSGNPLLVGGGYAVSQDGTRVVSAVNGGTYGFLDFWSVP